MDFDFLKIISKKCRYDIVRMISNAGSGHVGGSLSSIDIYVLLMAMMGENDRFVVSHGHSAAAVYSALGNYGYCDVEEAVARFRKEKPYEGHPSVQVNGVEWCSGALGQGLSVGCGFALGKKISKECGKVFVVMGDGEQQKGQLQEAREFAVKYKLDNLVAIVDFNGLQASGKVSDITPQSLADKYNMSGWKTVIVDGHNFEELYHALQDEDGPVCILAQTVMGKGIAEIENDYNYHGTVISQDLKNKVLAELELTQQEKSIIANVKKVNRKQYDAPVIDFKKGREYSIGEMVDVRSAMGNALEDIAKENPNVEMAALDCDLEGSVKLSGFKSVRPKGFVECGIAEHNAATVAAALSKSGFVAIHADFSVFNIAETYSQNRMADINGAPVKLFCTHAGLDVGEDGKTHQSIDYLSLLNNLYGFEVFVPADANQADEAVRYAMSIPKPVAIIGGRSKLPVLSINGKKLEFEYGKADILKDGKDAFILTYGNLVHKAVKIADQLNDEGVSIGVLNLSTPCKIDELAILKAAKTGLLITYEDHNVNTGIGGSIAKIVCENTVKCRVKCFGVKHYGSSTSPSKLYEQQGLDEATIKNEIKLLLKEK